MPEEKLEEEEERPEIAAGEPITSYFSPEAILMLFIAGLLDLIGIILLLFGLDDFWILDIIGLIFIGGWTYFRSQTLEVTRGAKARLAKKALKWSRRLKWLRPLLIISEFINYLGGLLFSWTLLVYFELKR